MKNYQQQKAIGSIRVVKKKILSIYVNKPPYGTFERTEALLKKYWELLLRAKEIGKKVCVSGILPRLCENEWWARAIGVNGRVHILCESIIFTYIDVWEDFVDKLYKKGGMHLNEKGVEVFVRRMDECLSLRQEN